MDLDFKCIDIFVESSSTSSKMNSQGISHNDLTKSGHAALLLSTHNHYINYYEESMRHI